MTINSIILQLIKILRGSFGIPKPFPLLFDISTGERIVEYAWVLKNLEIEEGKILDVGCYGTLFPLMLANLGYEVVGADLKNYKYTHPRFSFIRCDILSPPQNLLTQKFDAVICVSSLEHVGFSKRPIDYKGDIKAIRVLRDLLKQGGSLFLTFGYGNRFQLHFRPLHSQIPYGRLYDEKRIKLVSSGFEIDKKEVFLKANGYWTSCNLDEIKKVTYSASWIDTKSIACIKLRKL